MHIDPYPTYLASSGIDWQAEARELVLDMVQETESFRPIFVGERVYEELPFNADLSRHIHSRVAAALLIRDDQPDLALEFLEYTNEILPPKTVVRLPQDLSWALWTE